MSIYLGSYGDPQNSVRFSIGLLDVWFKYNPFSWQAGLCVPSAKDISIKKQIIYTLTGPLTSFFIATIACYFTFLFDLHDSIKIIIVAFLFSSVTDLFSNLSPRKKLIKLYNGKLIYNDGYQLKQLFFYKKLAKKYEYAIELYYKENFLEAANIFNQLLKSGLNNENIYKSAISSFLQVKDYSQVIELYKELAAQGNMCSDDFINVGFSYSKLGQHYEAIKYYDKALELDPNHEYSLVNKGFTLIVLEKFEESILVFNRAIEMEPSFSYSYSNRGLAKIKSGNEMEGLEDINYALELNEKDSYAFRSLGIHHLDKGDYTKALNLFKNAKEFDTDTYMIEELITKAEKNEK
ncbi:tetratricopeptide repeat protein [Siphonobacter sp. SORGH_AS_1065]|uniref:tetratricopeptide repeat protein n=1 Tax=Siphonobacter sp. SORGH_AS_1065 TaxID=3041795 RepID=UPI0027D854D0|nr:tetratricopeptide repeat protein [Siphonobacter sp. SORGH_AS_1065]